MENPSIRRTKIVCTIGPATGTERSIEKLVRAGMDCARLNFSHGTLSEHSRVIRDIRKVSKRVGKTVAILQDLPGPKIRVGRLAGGSVNLSKGSTVTLTTENVEGNEKLLPVGPKDLPKFVPRNGLVFLSDGTIRLRVNNTTETEIETRVEIGGALLSGKGVNIPQLGESFETFTDKDRNFLSFGLENDVDYVAVSFVRSARDMRAVREFVASEGQKTRKKKKSEGALLIAKIEKKDAVDNIEEIIAESDAAMVARGDLGVENPIETVPILQKMVISKCNARGIPVITATQILESMVNNASPTRAEVSDIANAIFDGTDALMLSEETAVGKYPLECVQVLDRVSCITESQMLKKPRKAEWETLNLSDVQDAASQAVSQISLDVNAKAIVSLLESGEIVPKISRFKPGAIIAGISHDDKSLRHAAINWGVLPIRTRRTTSLRDLLEVSVEALMKEKLVKGGEKIVVVRDRLRLSRQIGSMIFVAEASERNA